MFVFSLQSISRHVLKSTGGHSDNFLYKIFIYYPVKIIMIFKKCSIKHRNSDAYHGMRDLVPSDSGN